MKKAFALSALVLMLVTGTTLAYAQENASNPLAAVSNTDLRAQYFDLDGSVTNPMTGELELGCALIIDTIYMI